MNPSPAPWLSWAALVAGALLAGPYVFGVLRRGLNTGEFAKVLVKLLAARNLDRAMKLCRVEPTYPQLAATRAAIEQCMKGVAQGDPAAGYRDATALARAEVLAPVWGAFDASYSAVMRQLVVPRALAGVSLIPLFLTLGAWPRVVDSAPPAIVAVIALVTLAWTARADYKLDGARHTLFEALAPQFEALRRDPRAVSAAPTDLTKLRVEVSVPGQPPNTLTLDDDVIKIGRDPRSHVRVEAEGVARIHAVIEHTEDRWQIIDLGATAGTLVNGAAVRKQTLSDGDAISVGEASLRVRIGG